MKFPRSARIFRGPLDAAPFATVFFLLIIFLMLGSLVYTPGIHLDLPAAEPLPGLDVPSVAVALDRNGRLYFENQVIEESVLTSRLRQAAAAAPEPLTLLVQADKAVSYEMLLRLKMLAMRAGISNSLLATLPRAIVPPAARAKP